MMSLDKIVDQLKQKQADMPPVELWDPPYCGEIDIQIKANGDWLYENSVFKRLSLVKLFASVLVREERAGTSDYFLVTPVEKVKIVVEDAPFLLTQWQWIDRHKSSMSLETNLGDKFVLDKQHPLLINEHGGLYVVVRRNLLAKIHRNVYYQWVDMAREKVTKQGTGLIISSAGEDFCLGCVN